MQPGDVQRPGDGGLTESWPGVGPVAEVVDDRGRAGRVRRRQTGGTLPAPPSRKTSSMRWCRSCIRTSPSPRSTIEIADHVGRRLVADLDVDEATVGRSSAQPGVDQCLAEQPVGVGAALHLDQEAARAVQEVDGRGGSEQPAAVEDHDVVAHPLQLTEQVRGDQDRDPELGADAAHQRQHVVARRRVQPVGRLVQEHQSRVVDEGLRQLRPLLHAGGVAPHRAVPLLGEPDVAQYVGRALAGRDVRKPRHLAHVHDQVARGHVGGQAVVLGHVAHERANARAFGRDVVAEDPGRPRAGRHQAEQDLDQRGLAGAVGADEAGDALAHLHVELVESGHARVPLGQPRGFDHRHPVTVAARKRNARVSTRATSAPAPGPRPRRTGGP